MGGGEDEVESSNTGQLFTGGLDSIATYVRHYGESPNLITIKKRENAYEGKWGEAKDVLTSFAKENNVPWESIKSNLYYLMNHSYLEEEFSESLPTSSWWANVHVGLAYLSACAPITVENKIGTIYMASADSYDFSYSPQADERIQWFGYSPKIINQIAWGQTNAYCDGDLSRQEKWQIVIEHYDSKGGVHVQSCLTPGNCNSPDCKKCARNIASLQVEGADLEKYGYNMTEKFFQRVIENFENGQWMLDISTRKIWEDIQQHIPEDIDSADFPDHSKEFFEWLAGEDLAKYEK